MGGEYYYEQYNEDVDDIQETLEHIPVVILLVVATVSFYFQALVTEEVSPRSLH